MLWINEGLLYRVFLVRARIKYQLYLPFSIKFATPFRPEIFKKSVQTPSCEGPKTAQSEPCFYYLKTKIVLSNSQVLDAYVKILETCMPHGQKQRY